MRTTEAARQLGVSRDWILRVEREGKIPPVARDINGHRRYSRKALAQLRAVLFESPPEDAK
jgi:excisionase family DNA binding protein